MELALGIKRRGLILLEKFYSTDKTPLRYLCKCVYCGENTLILGSHFGRDESCGCQRYKIGKENKKFRGYEDISGRRWYSIVRNADIRGIELNITIRDAWDIFIYQNRKCMLTGELLIISDDSSTNTASLDRRDNTIGYTVGNIQWVNKKVNQIKMDLSMIDFIQLCQKVIKHNTLNTID